LDDAFIIMGSYVRMDPKKDVIERIDETVNEIGLSIFLTSLTSAIAFALGCTSSIPAVFWLCQYCFPTIIIVFVYQMTFFVACIAIDERRIQDGRCDVLICVKSTSIVDADGPGEHFGTSLL
jgi:Niemann-Pick C1 protein